jgi:hypothetical protein
MADLEYKPVPELSRATLEHDLASEDPAKISAALYSATYHDPDWHWVQEQCLRFLKHPHVGVRWNAATCLGDLAMFHKTLDLPRVLPELMEACDDENIRDAAETSISFINQSVKGEKM